MEPVSTALFASVLALGTAGIVLLLELRNRLRPWPGRRYVLSAPVTSGAPEHLFMSVHGLLRPGFSRLLRGQPWLAFAITGRPERVTFEVWVPEGEELLLDGLVRAAFPGAKLTPVDEPQASTGVVRVWR